MTTPPRYEELSLAAQTAIAEVLEQARAATLRRSLAALSGSFASKKVKGRTYWYYQYREIDGRLRQVYVGPDSEQVRALIARSAEETKPSLEPLARSAIALGAERILPKHFRVVRRLAEYGFFDAGGLLIGTHAFLTLGNMLGVRWRAGSRTQDVDFAHPGKNVSIALPANIEIDVASAIESLEMGLLPMTAFGAKGGATYLSSSDPELRLDFITVRDRRGDEPVRIPQLNLDAQPLPYMEFVLEDPSQGVILAERGAVVVNIPSALRFALHKLIVASVRPPRTRIKAQKDLLQAAALLAWAAKEDPVEVRSLWKELLARGPRWRKHAKQGRARLAAVAPDLDVASLLPE